MLETAVDWRRKRETLKAGRSRLFKRYLKSPNDIQLATEIKSIDDRIAECTERLVVNKGKR